MEIFGAAHGHELVIDIAKGDCLTVIMLQNIGLEFLGFDCGYVCSLVGMSVDREEGGKPLLRLQGKRTYLITEGNGGFGCLLGYLTVVSTQVHLIVEGFIEGRFPKAA